MWLFNHMFGRKWGPDLISAQRKILVFIVAVLLQTLLFQNTIKYYFLY